MDVFFSYANSFCYKCLICIFVLLQSSRWMYEGKVFVLFIYFGMICFAISVLLICFELWFMIVVRWNELWFIIAWYMWFMICFQTLHCKKEIPWVQLDHTKINICPILSMVLQMCYVLLCQYIIAHFYLIMHPCFDRSNVAAIFF